MCERRYQVGEHWYNLRPDALAGYRIGQQQFRFWLEWDRGTMNVRDLTIKFASYAHYIASREWARECSLLPVMVCIAPDVAQERRRVRVAKACLTYTHELVVWTTTEALLHEHGPLSPIWLKDSLLLPKLRSRMARLGVVCFVRTFQSKRELSLTSDIVSVCLGNQKRALLLCRISKGCS